MKNLLWIDCTAGGLAGVVMLMLNGWLSRLYALPPGLLLFIGAVNVAYACYSFALATRAIRPRPLINHLAGEAVFVGGLAGLEWGWREQLLTWT